MNRLLSHNESVLHYRIIKVRILNNLRFIKKLLGIGLDPNAKAETFALGSDTFFPQTYPLGNETTNWQRFLGWLDWLGPKPRRFEGSTDLYTEALTPGAYFLTHGAAANTSFVMCINAQILDKTAGQRRMFLFIEQSAAHVLDKFAFHTGSVNCKLNKHLAESGAVRQYSAKEVWEMPESS